MPPRHLKLLIISNLRYVYFSHHHGGFPLAEKTASFQTQLASTNLRKLRCSLNASKSFFTFSAACGSKLQGDLGKWKCCELEKKRRSFFEFYDSAELIFWGFCEKFPWVSYQTAGDFKTFRLESCLPHDHLRTVYSGDHGEEQPKR